MAEEQVGLGKEQVREPAPWTKIFTGFRVAADPKKLLLAAAGIFVMALGWWILASFFYTFYRDKVPQWSTYENEVGKGKRFDDPEKAFDRYKQDLNNWNLMHKLAGPVSGTKGEEFTLGDFAKSYKEYKDAEKELEAIAQDLHRKDRRLKVETEENNDKAVFLSLDNFKLQFTVTGVKADAVKNALLEKKLTAGELVNANPSTDRAVNVKSYDLTLDPKSKDEWAKFEKYVTTPRSTSDLRFEVKDYPKEKQKAVLVVLELEEQKIQKVYKPAGWLATWPWFEYRGPNPYLVMTGELLPSAEPELCAQTVLNWFYSQIPVLLEPLVKFLSPLVYFFSPAASFWTRFYLLLVILWTIATWSLFGGAITRMAAVQAVRPTERVGMVGAIRFAVSRYRAFIASQLLPFAFLAGLAVLLVIFGLFEMIPLLGDIFVAGLGFPLVLVLGLVMAVVLGLTGWPLMYATIGTEGSDSFDAISRSYSYVYQAPWQYIWYGFLALLYGAVLVFFVGLMGSLLVYLGKWGMSLPVFVESREPSYLFQYAPTSYGWRDLLLHNSPNVGIGEIIQNTGRVVPAHMLNRTDLAFWNQAGASLVAFWLYLLFLMIIGFGYSYFWSASSIIYLFMRRKVDDTEMDEVHLEEEEIDTPAYAPPAPPAAPAPSPGRPTMSLNVVDGPAAAPPPPPVQVAAPATPVATPAADATAAASAKKTQLATSSALEGDDSQSAGSPKKTQLAPGSALEGDENQTGNSGPGSPPSP